MAGVDFTGTNTTNEDSAASIAPINNGDAFSAGTADDGAGVQNRPTQALRVRTEILKQHTNLLEHASYVLDRPFFLSVKPGADEKVTWNGTVAEGGDGKFTLSAAAELWVTFGAIPTGGRKSAQLSVDAQEVGDGDLRIIANKRTYESPSGNEIDVTTVIPAGTNANLVFTITGDPLRHIVITLQSLLGVATTTVADVVAAINADMSGPTVQYSPDFASLTALIEALEITPGICPSNEAFPELIYLAGGFEDVQLRVSAAQLEDFFNTAGAPMEEGDVLVYLIENEEERRKTYPTGPNDPTVGTPALLTIKQGTLNAYNSTYAIPIARVLENRLIFSNGTSVAAGGSAILGSGATDAEFITLDPTLLENTGAPTEVQTWAENVDDKFDETTGHTHSGAAGQGPKISAANVTVPTAVQTQIKIWETANTNVDNVNELVESVDRSLNLTSGHAHTGANGHGPKLAAANSLIALSPSPNLDAWETIVTVEDLAEALELALDDTGGHDHSGGAGMGPTLDKVVIEKEATSTFYKQTGQSTVVDDANFDEEMQTLKLLYQLAPLSTGSNKLTLASSGDYNLNRVGGNTKIELQTVADFFVFLTKFGYTRQPSLSYESSTLNLLATGAGPVLIAYNTNSAEIILLNWAAATTQIELTEDGFGVSIIDTTDGAHTKTNNPRDVTSSRYHTILLGVTEGTAANPSVLDSDITVYGTRSGESGAVLCEYDNTPDGAVLTGATFTRDFDFLIPLSGMDVNFARGFRVSPVVYGFGTLENGIGDPDIHIYNYYFNGITKEAGFPTKELCGLNLKLTVNGKNNSGGSLTLKGWLHVTCVPM